MVRPDTSSQPPPEPTPRAHARLSASGSATWANCAASVRMQAGIPDEESEYAAEGTRAHAFAEACLRYGLDPLKVTPKQLAAACTDENPIPLPDDDEMREKIAVYVDAVRSLVAALADQHGQTPVLLLEQRVDYSQFVPGGFGTADVVVVVNGHLYVLDLKYGRGERVEVEGNTQGLLYALGTYSSLGWLYDIQQVHIRIIQPRLDHDVTWTVTLDELLAEGDRLSAAAQATQDPDAPFNPGAKQCRWCKARGVCRARGEWLQAHKQANARDDFENSDAYTPAELAELLPVLDQHERWVKDVREAAFNAAMHSELPGYKVVAGRANRRWADPAAAAEAMRGWGWKKSEIFEEKIIGIPAAERLAKQKFKRKTDRLDALIDRPPGKPTLAPESDPRPVLVTDPQSAARQDFSPEMEN